MEMGYNKKIYGYPITSEECSVPKKTFRLAGEEVEQLEKKIRKHRRKIVRVILLLSVLALIAAGSLYYIYETKKYVDFLV